MRALYAVFRLAWVPTTVSTDKAIAEFLGVEKSVIIEMQVADWFRKFCTVYGDMVQFLERYEI